jgi:hypothetical protein
MFHMLMCNRVLILHKILLHILHKNITNYNYKLTTTKVGHVRPGSSAIDLGSRDSRTCLMIHGMVQHDDSN